MRAPTHRAEQHGTGMVTHNYGSADGATYQTREAEVRVQEAVGLRQRDWRAMCLGPMQGHLGGCRGSCQILARCAEKDVEVAALAD